VRVDGSRHLLGESKRFFVRLSGEGGVSCARVRAFQFRVARGIFRVRGQFDINANDPNEEAACQ
jgi:hypothetical protein